MKVGEAMTRDVRIARPDQTLYEVARTMAEVDTGTSCLWPVEGISEPGGSHSQTGGPRT